MEKIFIYDLDEKAYEYYKNNSKRCKDVDYEIAKRRLTAYILNAFEVKKLFDNLIYKFSGFNIVVNEKSKKIVWVYWNNNKHKGRSLKESEIKKLEETFLALGLDKTGKKLYKNTNNLKTERGFANGA